MLKEKGYQLADSLSCLTWASSGHLPVTRLLPLQRIDGKKLKRGEPGSVNISHCPFCGTQYGQNVKVHTPLPARASDETGVKP